MPKRLLLSCFCFISIRHEVCGVQRCCSGVNIGFPLGRPHPNTGNFTKRRKPSDNGNCYRVTKYGANKSCQSVWWRQFTWLLGRFPGAQQSQPACGYNCYAALKCPAEQKLWSLPEKVAHDVRSCSHLASTEPLIQPLAAIRYRCPPNSWTLAAAHQGQRVGHVTPTVFLHREGGGGCYITVAAAQPFMDSI